MAYQQPSFTFSFVLLVVRIVTSYSACDVSAAFVDVEVLEVD
jgi:hypothetical protein